MKKKKIHVTARWRVHQSSAPPRLGHASDSQSGPILTAESAESADVTAPSGSTTAALSTGDLTAALSDAARASGPAAVFGPGGLLGSWTSELPFSGEDLEMEM